MYAVDIMNMYDVFSNVGHVQAEFGVIIAAVLAWVIAAISLSMRPMNDIGESVCRIIMAFCIGYAILWLALWNAAQVDARPGYAVALGAFVVARAVIMLMP